MFGFTLDAFSKIETVASLGLEMRMLKDYQMFASDYFRWVLRRRGRHDGCSGGRHDGCSGGEALGGEARWVLRR